MQSGWYCPFCNAHHAPHVDTCPKQNSREVRYVPIKSSGGTMTHDAVIPVEAAKKSPSEPGLK